MKIDAILSPAELPALAERDLRGTACVVFDVLRATSTFATALHNGAKAVIPVGEIPEAIAFKKKQPDVLLGGERDGVKIRAEQSGGIDFDLGNSPREYTPEKVRGKTIVSTTTNGTRALRACAGAQTVLAASFLNLGATAEFLRANNFQEVLLVCAGTRDNPADEDIIAAGAMVEILFRDKAADELSGPAKVCFQIFTLAKSELDSRISNSENGRRLLAIPDLRDDVAFCLQRDIFPLVARMDADGAIRVVSINNKI
jgi:2-phosphosulfolactate phosphatase